MQNYKEADMTRGERRTRTEKIVAQRMDDLKRIYNKYRPTEIPEAKIGRARKHSPYDCGNPKCFCCHYTKIMKLAKHSDLKKEIE